MKKFLSILTFCIGSISISYAQLDAGEIIVGGALGLSSETSSSTVDGVTTDGDPQVEFNFAPRGGYFLSEDLEVGLRLGYNSSKTGDSDFKTVNTRMSFGPYVRKYFELGSSVYVYGQGRLGIGWGKTKASGGGTTTKTDNYSSLAVGVSPGLMYRVGDRVALELGAGFLGYSSYTNKNPAGGADKTKSSKFGLDLDLRSFNLGVSIFL